MKHLFFLFALIFWQTLLFSQNIRHIGVQEGLSGRQAFVIKQDKKGFIWIATRFGVDRYDGSKIKHYPIPILSSQYPIRKINLISTQDSSIWAYTDGGPIYFYNKENDAFDLYRNLHLNLKTLSFDDNDQIWFGSKSYFGTIEKGSVVAFKDFMLKDQDVKKIIHRDLSRKIIVTNQDIFDFDVRSGKLKPIIAFGLNKINNIQIETAYYDADRGQLWIGTISNGILIYAIKERSFKKIKDLKGNSNPILCILPINDSTILIGTDGMGAWVIDKNTYKHVHSYRQQGEKNSSLSGDGIYDIFKDKDERIWMSTYSGGVNVFDFNKYEFEVTTFGKSNIQTSSKENIITGMIEDTHNNLWVGTHNGISYFNAKSRTWNFFLKSISVFALCEDSKGQLWAGTYGSGVYVLNKQGKILKHFTNIKGRKDCVGTDFVYSITQDAFGNIWIGGKKGVLSKYSVDNNAFTQVPINLINVISKKDEGHLFIGTESGVYELYAKTNEYRSLPINKHLKSLYIGDIHVESDSIMWLASYGAGLIRCNYKNNSLKYFNKNNGFLSDIVYGILSDKENNIWVSTEEGISKIDPLHYSIENYNNRPELSNINYRQASRLKNSSGKMFFGAFNGLIAFDPQKIHPLKVDSRLVFLNFKLFNKTSRPNDINSPLKKPIDDLNQIELSYKEHSFSLEFTAISLSDGNKKQYMWKLEGLDKDWIGPSADNIANYTNLLPGNYIFKVKIVDDNLLTLDKRELKVTITPPIWKRPWARILEVIFVFFVLYLIYRYIRYIYDKKRSDDKIKFFIDTTHDLRTPLTLMSAPLFELKEKLDLDTWNSYLLDLVTTNLGKLNKMVSQLLDFQKAYEGKDQLILNKKELNNYLAERVMYWKPVAIKKGIALGYSSQEKELEEWIDIYKMDKILDNLISNAIKYTSQKGKIDVKLSSNKQYWQITVSDDGIGIPKSAIKKLFRRFYRTQNAINSQETGSGLGLLLIKNYVNALGGTVKVNSIESEGSVFVVRFKHGQRHLENSVMLDESDYPIHFEEDMKDEVTDLEHVKIKLLIVEDNQDLREYMKLSLSHYYKTFEAANGQVAWDMISTINPDIIVSDLNMPEMDGLALCQKIKNTFEFSHIPVILLTVIKDEKGMETGLKTGADDYILKPFDIKHLKIKIDNIIGNRKLMRMKFMDLNKKENLENEHENSMNDVFIKKAVKIIEEHIMDSDFSIHEFSREMGLSRTLLFTKFNSITGYTPNDFIKLTKMKKAIQLFREKKYMISEVANLTGYVDPSYFATCFKKIYGKTPKQFIEEEIT